MTMTQSLAKQLSQEILVAVEGVAKKHGLEVRYTGGQYSASEFRPKLVFRMVEVVNGVKMTPEAAAYTAQAAAFGLDPGWLNKEFSFRGSTYRVVGLVASRPKYPVEAILVRTGKTYKFAASQVKLSFAADAASRKAEEKQKVNLLDGLNLPAPKLPDIKAEGW